VVDARINDGDGAADRGLADDLGGRACLQDAVESTSTLHANFALACKRGVFHFGARALDVDIDCERAPKRGLAFGRSARGPDVMLSVVLAAFQVDAAAPE